MLQLITFKGNKPLRTNYFSLFNVNELYKKEIFIMS